MSTYKNCQSCGMPLKKDPNHGGTESDCSKSVMYCSYCYQEGAFTQPDWTVGQMQDFCKSKLREMGFPGILASWMTKSLPRLERWK